MQGAIAIRNDGSFASPVRAKEGIHVLADTNTIERLTTDQSLFFQKLWLYPHKAESGGILTPNSGDIYLGKSGDAGGVTLDSVVGRGSTTVLATKAGHGFENGMSVVIAGATPSDINGTWVVKNATPNTFEFVIAVAVGVLATGTISATRAQYLPDVLTPDDTQGMAYQLPDGMKMRLADVIVYGAATDGVFYSYT